MIILNIWVICQANFCFDRKSFCYKKHFVKSDRKIQVRNPFVIISKYIYKNFKSVSTCFSYFRYKKEQTSLKTTSKF